MLPLAIWLVLIGYTVTWTGKMNLGVTYVPQSDGTIQPVGSDGKPARTYTLMDAVTCAQPSGQPQGTKGPAPAAPPPEAPPPTLPHPIGVPNPITWVKPILGLLPSPQPQPEPEPGGGVTLPGGIRVPGVGPTPLPGGGRPGLLDEAASFVHQLLSPVVTGFGSAFGGFHL